jgi:hypothetical protein
MPLTLIFIGILLLSTGLVGMFLGGYMLNGEAHSNTAEGLPTLLFGLGALIVGLLAMVRGVRSFRAKTKSPVRE